MYYRRSYSYIYDYLWFDCNVFAGIIWNYHLGSLASYSTIAYDWIDWASDWLCAQMKDLKLNYKSARSEKARISVMLDQTWLIILSIIMILLLISGIALIVF